jgi:glutamate dehydrogenase/leucine dehydrogenase
MVAADHLDMDIEKSTFAIEGFGNVGEFAAKFLTEAGAKMVGVSDSKGTLYNKDGIDYNKLIKIKQEKGSVINYSGTVLPNKDIIKLSADILIPAAVPNLIISADVDRIKAKLIVEGSNIPMDGNTEELLHKKNVLVIPDFVANAGGVISSYVEYINGKPDEMFRMVEKKIKSNVKLILDQSNEHTPRDVAMNIAKKRVRAKCKTCRVY